MSISFYKEKFMNQWLSKSSIVLFIAILLAVLGGIYFGLFSCGGYAWHKDIFYMVFALTLLLVFIFPLSILKKIPYRLLSILLLIVLFIVVQAAASTFYPTNPASISDFFQGFYLALQDGPC